MLRSRITNASNEIIATNVIATFEKSKTEDFVEGHTTRSI